MLTADRLRSLLRYDPDTGTFVWAARTSNRIKIGDVAGRPHNRGYVAIGVDGRVYLAHRLAWLWATGNWPRLQVDHINGARNVRDDVTTNGVESVFAVMKRGLICVYHHASKKHLGRYVDEFAFRLNEGDVKRHTMQRLDSFIDSVAGKRLTYKALTH